MQTIKTTQNGDNMNKFTKTALLLSIQSALMASASYADEQETDTSGVEKITVTALKRTQTIQEVPASVVAISPENITDYLGAGENIRALAGRVPSLQIESSNGRQSPRFYIRGLGNTDFDVNANQPVSLVLDEVALENSVLKGIPLFDLERVEVLAGPQGTLFGRNTPAGIVKVESAKPDFDAYGYLSAGYGSRGTLFVEGAKNLEVSDKIALRGSMKYQERDTWIDNLVRNEQVGAYDELAFRVQALYDSGSDFKALVKLHGFEQDGDMPQVFYGNALAVGKKGVRPGFDETKIYHDSPSGFDMSHLGASVRLEFSVDDIDFTSVTGYDSVDSFSYSDIDGGQTISAQQDARCKLNGAINGLIGCFFAPVGSGDGLADHMQLTQELRAAMTLDDTFIQAGIYYFLEDYTVDNKDLDINFNTTAFTQVDQKTTSYALFSQVEQKYSENLAVNLGLRYTWDDKELDINRITAGSAESHNKDDSYLNWDLSARYTINDNWTSFARIGNASRGPVTIGRFGFYSEADTETLTSYELGLKSILLNGDVRWNITAYTYDIKDHQLTATGGEANTNSLLNAENVFGAGIETDLQANLTDNLSLNFNLSYNKTEIQDKQLRAERCASTPTCSATDPVANTVPGPFGPVTTVFIDGNPLPRSPEWMSNIIFNYQHEYKSGYLYAQTDWNYRSDSNIFLYEAVEFTAESRWLGGVRFGYKTDNGLDIALVGRNITDEIVVDGAVDFLNLTAFVNEPSYWGVELRMEFE